MYVIPFAMGPLDSPICKIGIEIIAIRLTRGREHAPHDAHGQRSDLRNSRADGAFVPVHALGRGAACSRGKRMSHGLADSRSEG